MKLTDTFPDHSTENAERYRKQQAFTRRKHWGSNNSRETFKAIFFPTLGLILALTGITIIIRATADWIDEVPVWGWTIFALAGIAGILIIMSARKSRV